MSSPVKPEYAYDAEADMGYRRLADGPVARTVEVSDELAVDLDADGRAVGVEFHGAILMAADRAHRAAAMDELVRVTEELGLYEATGGPTETR